MNNLVEPTQSILTCQTCHGAGVLDNKTCQACGGWGAVALLDGKLIYTDLKLSLPLIVLRGLKKTVYKIIDIVVIVCAVLGIFSLIWWYLQLPQQLASLNELLFWRQRHILILIFYLSLVVDMLWLYRHRQKFYATQKIKPWPATNNPIDFAGALKARRVNAGIAFNEALTQVLEKAYFLAIQLKQSQITPLHLIYSLLTGSGEIAGLFFRMNVDGSKLLDEIGNQLSKLPATNGSPVLSPSAKLIIAQGYVAAYTRHQTQVGPVDLLLPIWQADKLVQEIFYDLAIDQDKLQNTVAWAHINEQLIANYKLYKQSARFKPGNNMDRAYTAVATPFLDQLSFDLTAAAKYGQLAVCVGRDNEIKQIFERITEGEHGVILVGPTGVGKDEIVEGLAQLMVTEAVPKMFKDKRLLEVDLARLLGGASPAEAQNRMLEAVNETVAAGNIILYMQNIENLTGLSSGSGDSLDLAEIMASMISRQGVYVLATCTPEHFTHSLENGPLAQVLSKIEVNEPDDNKAIQMIESKISWLEHKFNVLYTYDALAESVKLSSRYMHDRYLPEKAIDVLEKAGVTASAKGPQAVVTGEEVSAVISEATHVPVSRVNQVESQLLLNLETKIHERMVGQEEAVKVVSESLRRARAELREGKRPIANFLFLGPTGVGKTELAKTIAQVYFGQENYMIRLDMSEYQLADSVGKMIGTPEGIHGYLTEKVRQAPFSLILLDEIEKAHPDILNLFLQVMDDGRLTDGQGRTIDFTNSIIIATSNIGAVYIQEQVKAGTDLNKIKDELVDKYLVEKMRPELINRFDGVIVFRPLTVADVAIIARLMLNKTKDLLEAKGMNLEISDAGLQVLAAAGFEPEFGARPLRRLLQDRIDNAVANKLLAGELARRDTVKINDQGQVEVIKAPAL